MASPIAAQERHVTLAIDSSMLVHLERLAEQADAGSGEDARCIMGTVTPDTVSFNVAADTPYLVVDREWNTVTWRWWDCPPGTVALWHSHPSSRFQEPPARQCYLSGPNGRRPGGDEAILNAEHAPPYAIVSVRRGVTCVFVRRGKGRAPIKVTVDFPR